MVLADISVSVCLTMASAPSPGLSMSHWVLSCPACYTVFNHSEIPPRSQTEPFDPLWPRKPDFPENGMSLTCPHCQKSSVFRTYCAARGFDLIREYVDVGQSGAKDARPELDKLIGDAHKRQFDAVVVWRLDRLVCSTKHLLAALEEFRSLGVQFI